MSPVKVQLAACLRGLAEMRLSLGPREGSRGKTRTGTESAATAVVRELAQL